MKFTLKKKKGSDGSTTLSLTFVFREDEVSALDRIPDDPNVSLNLRTEGDTHQKADWALLWLRIAVSWVDIWNRSEEFKGYLQESIRLRSQASSRASKRKRKSR